MAVAFVCKIYRMVCLFASGCHCFTRMVFIPGAFAGDDIIIGPAAGHVRPLRITLAIAHDAAMEDTAFWAHHSGYSLQKVYILYYNYAIS